MFGLVDGRFVTVDIPHEQLGPPDVHAFLRELAAALA
jgi:hypothetical protein